MSYFGGKGYIQILQSWFSLNTKLQIAWTKDDLIIRLRRTAGTYEAAVRLATKRTIDCAPRYVTAASGTMDAGAVCSGSW